MIHPYRDPLFYTFLSCEEELIHLFFRFNGYFDTAVLARAMRTLFDPANKGGHTWQHASGVFKYPDQIKIYFLIQVLSIEGYCLGMSTFKPVEKPEDTVCIRLDECSP